MTSKIEVEEAKEEEIDAMMYLVNCYVI